MTTMTHDGYQAIVEFDSDAKLFHGEVIGLRDVITFQGRSVDELQKAFKESVADYLDFCRERGEEPEKSFSGQFVVRTNPAAHRRAVLLAKRKGLSLNAWINNVIESASAREDPATASRKPATRSVAKRPSRIGKHAANP